MNSVTLIGKLASEVDVREFGEGKRLATFLLAVDRPGDRGGADFVRVAAWNGLAETCRPLARGSRVAVDGRLRSRSWEEDGKRRSAVEVSAASVDALAAADAITRAETPFAAAAAQAV